jgi:hypothetical protein
MTVAGVARSSLEFNLGSVGKEDAVFKSQY